MTFLIGSSPGWQRRRSTEASTRIFLTGGFDVYALLSLYVGRNSFGKSYAALPTDNVFINQADAANDLVFRSAPASERSLSGVIAHEITHLWMRKRFGYWRNLAMPVWKKEGYAEYVAGGSTLDYQTGLRLWKRIRTMAPATNTSITGCS